MIPNDTEHWHPIDQWVGLYEVSNFGRVRSLNRVDRLGRHWPGRALRATVDRSTGYQKVNLNGRGVHRHAYVHHLVAETFLGTRPPQREINHIDGVKTNNHVSNLEYVEQAENIRHAFRTGLNRGRSRFGSTNPNAKLTEPLAQLVLATRGKISGAELARILGISNTIISRVRLGKAWRHLHDHGSLAAA